MVKLVTGHVAKMRRKPWRIDDSITESRIDSVQQAEGNNIRFGQAGHIASKRYIFHFPMKRCAKKNNGKSSV